MSAAIYYHPEAYTTSGPKLMGRNAAGESFLRGFLLHSKASEFWLQTQQAEHAEHFAKTAVVYNRAEAVNNIDKQNLNRLTQAGTLYCPGPGIGEHAYHRAGFGHAAWSLCGITHTTSSAFAMDAIADLITAPVQPWDAVICTSTAVKDNVLRLLDAQQEYLKARLGANKFVLPELPVIPLGIHCGDFVFSDEEKLSARALFGADEQTIVVLFTGRLSFHAKAHPLAMYQALEKAAAIAEKKILLVECGWHANESIASAYRLAAEHACPSVRVVNLDGRNTEARKLAWAGADIFCSLSDNIQETFGITPIEAMAAGLPVVVSDWDGYKDTIRDGIDGFRIATLMPQSGLGGDLALRHALEIDNYDRYCGHSCCFVAVDIEATAQAFIRLIQDSVLRTQMGQAGRRRAQERYDWAAIIPQYEALWNQMSEIRQANTGQPQPPSCPWPARMDPFHAFAAYPTETLTPQTVLALADQDAETALRRTLGYCELVMVNFAAIVLPSKQELATVLDNAASGPKTASELIRGLSLPRQPFVFRCLAWLLKLGVLKLYR